MKTREEIKAMNHIELYHWLQEDIKLTQEEFNVLRSHKLIDADIQFWTRVGNIREYSISILKPNLNLYADVDIFVVEEE